jgi:hypothetical protein
MTIRVSLIYTLYRLLQLQEPGLVGIATSYGLDDRGVRVQVQVESKFSLLHVIQIGSEVHPTSYSLGSGGKAAGA